MNRDQIKQNLHIFQAFADGKIVQFRRKGCGDRDWCELKDDGSFNFHEFEYRVKPEPKTLHVVRNCHKTIVDTYVDGNVAQKRVDHLNTCGGSKPYTLEEYLQVVK